MAGFLVLAEIEHRLGIAERLARCLEDPRSPERTQHGLAEMIRFRALLIAAGYEDANDCDVLRADPAFKMAVGRLPESGAELCSQPTMCRLENLPGPIALKRMMAAMIELFCDSFAEVPRRIVLDIDDTEDRVHGGQQLSLFHAHYDSRCFLPIHIYEATTGKPVAMILRPGKTPDGTEVALVLRHVVKAIRARWPRVEILIRGDSHYSHEVARNSSGDAGRLTLPMPEAHPPSAGRAGCASTTPEPFTPPPFPWSSGRRSRRRSSRDHVRARSTAPSRGVRGSKCCRCCGRGRPAGRPACNAGAA